MPEARTFEEGLNLSRVPGSTRTRYEAVLFRTSAFHAAGIAFRA